MKFRTWLASIPIQTLLIGIAGPVLAKAGPAADRLATQHFFCKTGYALGSCLEQIAALKAVVAKYPTEVLGEWTWVLVRSQDWKPLIKMLGLNADSPAFTCLETKTTFIEEALVAKVPGRASDLVARWHLGMTELLNTAVEHEMAHAICHSRDEGKANHVAGILKQNRPLTCQSGL
jgi:hypothetical protein